MKKLKSIKEQLIATTQNAKKESEERLNQLDLNERINRAESIIDQEKNKTIKKPPSEKVARDAFTLQKIDIDTIRIIKQKCLKAGVEVNKSLIVRAGIHVLSDMAIENLIEVINTLPKIKIGRPKI
jgi:hypothetical protein